MRVGVPDFVCVRPLVYGMTSSGDDAIELQYDQPGNLSEALSRGTYDAALIPSIEYLRGAGHFFVDDVALVAKPFSGSLLLLTDKPIEQIERIAVGEYCRSPIAVARIVLAELHGVTPDILVEKFITGDWRERYDAVLLGGDLALQQLFKPDEKATAHSITDMWFKMTAQPLVLGMWAYRDKAIGAELTDRLTMSRNLGIQNLSRLADGIGKTTEYGSEFLYHYLQQCWDYQFGKPELEGLRTLEERAMRYDLLRSSRLSRVEHL